MSGDDKPRDANWIDDTILRMADSHSPEEISVALDSIISPAAVAAHTQTLLKSRHWLTAAQEEQLLTLKMKAILAKLEDRYLDNDNAKIQLSLLKEIGGRLDKRLATTEADINSFYAAQAIQVGQVIELALQKTLESLRKTHPELGEADARQALRLALPVASAEVEARTVNE